ncbi:MAG: hypothetical protein RMJ19_05810 [Gemmatales bacterium]|nr:hypothetical protein [Gemmatales bacterium]MCS7159968.1 hypothetical protein [Gemmatales bacterium]MDW8175167.1 hypothetical protein [Gemmatales bacterium]MDW8223922.1 hypothetical protein [Gemmatales bacterium]
MARAPAISKLSISEIQKMLNKRLNQLRALQEQIESTLAQLGQIEQQATEEIRQELRAVQGDGERRGPRAAAPAAAPPKRRGRPPQAEAGSLREYILKVLRDAGRPMRPKEVEQAVLDAGYKTTSQRFSVIVNQTLTKLVESGQVKRDPNTRTYAAA